MPGAISRRLPPRIGPALSLMAVHELIITASRCRRPAVRGAAAAAGGRTAARRRFRTPPRLRRAPFLYGDTFLGRLQAPRALSHNRPKRGALFRSVLSPMGAFSPPLPPRRRRAAYLTPSARTPFRRLPIAFCSQFFSCTFITLHSTRLRSHAKIGPAVREWRRFWGDVFTQSVAVVFLSARHVAASQPLRQQRRKFQDIRLACICAYGEKTAD